MNHKKVKIEKAIDAADFLASDMRALMSDATRVEADALVQAIEQVRRSRVLLALMLQDAGGPIK